MHRSPDLTRVMRKKKEIKNGLPSMFYLLKKTAMLVDWRDHWIHTLVMIQTQFDSK